MKKNDLKRVVKKSGKAKPLTKGVVLKSSKEKIPNPKHQITSKSQIPSIKSQTRFCHLGFKNWKLEISLWSPVLAALDKVYGSAILIIVNLPRAILWDRAGFYFGEK